MKKDGPVVANLLLDGILREDLSPIVTAEEGVIDYYRRPTRPVAVRLTLDGKPLAGAEVLFVGQGKEPRQPKADGVSGSDGAVRLSTYAAYDGVPPGDYKIAVSLRKPRWTPEGKDGPDVLAGKYGDPATSGLSATVKASGKVEIRLELAKGAKP